MSDDEKTESCKFTEEQKIVAAVWVHEREHNDQGWKDIQQNFMIRFNTMPPRKRTLLRWERKLFTYGMVKDRVANGRPIGRLMHVPYVKDSLIDAPELSLRERSKLLGLPRSTLFKILKDDLHMEFEVEEDEDSKSTIKAKYTPNSGGKWKKKAPEATDFEMEDVKPLIL